MERTKNIEMRQAESCNACDDWKARILATLSTDDGANGNVEKRLTECWDTAWSPDGSLFAWSCGQRTVRVVFVDDIKRNVQDYSDLIKIDCRQVVTSLAFVDLKGYAPEVNSGADYRITRWEEHQHVLAVGLRNGRIRVFDVHTGRILLELLDHTDNVSCLTQCPDNTLTLASSSFDGTVKFWDLADDGNMAKSLTVADYTSSKRGKHKVTSIAWSPDALRLAATGTFKTVVIFDTITHLPLLTFNGHGNRVNTCSFSPDGMLMMTGSVDTTAIVWNSHSGEIVSIFGHQYPPPSEWFPGDGDTSVVSCGFAKNAMEVVTVASDGYLRLWDLAQPYFPTLIAQIDEPLCFSFNDCGDLIAVGNSAGNVSIVQHASHIMPLLHLSRMASNNSPNITFDGIDKLKIPTNLKRFLKYEYLDL